MHSLIPKKKTKMQNTMRYKIISPKLHEIRKVKDVKEILR